VVAHEILTELRWTDLVDLLATTLLIYSLLLLIRGTRAVQILLGLLVLGGLLTLAKAFHLIVVATLLQFVLVGTAVTLPIVFQPELRRALESLGRGEFFGRPATSETNGNLIAQNLAAAAFQLSRARWGGLIAIEVASGLQDVAENGTAIDARISSELVVTLFSPIAPLHDGAVIIRGDRIVAAGCVLPLAEGAGARTSTGRRVGTRHRAALGLSEQTDSVIVVISEETGQISVARGGKLSRVVDDEERLRKVLLACSRPPRVRTAAVGFWSRVRERIADAGKVETHA
jgi:diadenylate cyclase